MPKYYNTNRISKPYFSPPITTYKNTRQTSYHVLPFFTVLALCVIAIAWLNTQANNAAATAHATYCTLDGTPREACDPFYQQLKP